MKTFNAVEETKTEISWITRFGMRAGSAARCGGCCSSPAPKKIGAKLQPANPSGFITFAVIDRIGSN